MASTYLSKTFAQAGNRRTFTISYWIKMGQVSTGADQAIMGAAQDGSNSDDLYIHTGRLNFSGYYGSTAYQVRTTAKYRDLSGWYHHVIRFDSTQSTASDRLRLYVNGELQSVLDSNTYPSQNLETTYFNTARQHTIGSIAYGVPNLPFNGSMSHFHFCDGYSYGADSFGETDSTTGEWKIIVTPSVSYGTNGFFILKNGNSVTDQSGQGNNWSVGGGTLTKTEDNPSNVFATLNPLYTTQGTETYATGNNTYKSNSNQFGTAISTIAPNSGKWYFEVKSTFDDGTKGFMGFMDIDNSFLTSAHKYLGMSGTNNCGVGYYGGGNIVANGNQNIYTGLHDWNDGDILGCALDIDNNKAYFHVNGTYLTLGGNVQNPSSGQYGIDTSSSLYGGAVGFGVSSKDNYNVYTNFGNGSFHDVQLTGTTYQDSNNQGIFKYQPPTNFLALCTKNLNV